MSDLSVQETSEARAVPAARVSDYIALLKPRVMSLVVFTGLIGMMMAPGTIDPVIGFTAILCIAVAAGASGAINMWYDADIDAIMTRTRKRPIPAGRNERGEALAFGATLAVISVLLLELATNMAAAVLLALSILYYVFIYTMWLKRRTPQNIVIGGAAGAFPPMIGWAAVTGDVELGGILLFTIIFMWTPPHFWALSLFKRGDYEAARVPMLPVVAGDKATRVQILIYTLALFPITLLPAVIGMTGMIYNLGALVLGGMFIYRAVRVYFAAEDDYGPAKRMFAFSILYLFLLFALLPLDRWLGGMI